MNFLQFPVSTDYIFSMPWWNGLGRHTSTRLRVLPSWGIVVEPSPIRSLAADYPLWKHLGFNLMSSISFFLLSPHSHLAVFHAYVVADIALGYSSSSCRLLHSAKNYDYTQISLCAYLVAAYIPIAKARGITPLFDKNPTVKFWKSFFFDLFYRNF